MKVVDLYSKRRKAAAGQLPDVFTYDNVPPTLRAQIVHILRDALGQCSSYDSASLLAFRYIYDTLCREYGVFVLGPEDRQGYPDRSLCQFLLSCNELDRVLDVIELSFQVVDRVVRSDYAYRESVSMSPDDAIAELNARFREHGVGYQFESGQLIRVDSDILHSEVVKPTLQLLTEKIYVGANEEFLKAHEHYRKGRYEECLNECLKAFESTMKGICAKRNWAYAETDTASRLIDICFGNGLVPAYLQAEFAGLRSTLESGVPTVRNRLSAHGRGVQQRIVPEHFVRYVLYMTAASIRFLVEAEHQLP